MTGRTRGPGSIFLVLATAATSWLTLSSWGGFVERNSVYMVPVLFGILSVSLAGHLSRWARFPVVVVAAAQLLTVFLFLNVAYGSSWFPTPSSITATTQVSTVSTPVAMMVAQPVR